ncbi:MAG: hypothetical protein HQM14_11850 [SAR324 cluster bacterium]|nr:hypothetical protein [SAR324 cluster bacterium]
MSHVAKFLMCLASILCGLNWMTAVRAQLPSQLAGNIHQESPPFLSPSQVLEDIAVYEGILRESYARFPILQQNGLDWDNVFFNLKASLSESNQKILTKNFLEKLMETLQFTEDTSFRAEFSLHKRLYQSSVGSDYLPLYTTITLVKQNDTYRVLPDSFYPKIANQWFIRCFNTSHQLFPIVPERQGEQRFILGKFTNKNPSSLECLFADGLGKNLRQSLKLEHHTSIIYSEKDPVFTWTPGHIPYIRWMREGHLNDSDTQRFFSISSQIRSSNAFIIDVRGNVTGSFGFIDQWLRPITSKNWHNTIIREKQSKITLEGVLNRLEYLRNSSEASYEERLTLNKEKQRMLALLRYVESQNIPYRMVETKFSFSGNPSASWWNKRMIVVVNRHCGDGCQFLAASAKQLKNSFLVGENPGNFPKTSRIPLYQLPHSKIRVSVNHRLHLDPDGIPISPSGHQPDFWLDHPASLSEIYRLARSTQL